MLQWDDLRYFLALYRHGKLSNAGKSLNVRHTTVARRVKELETALNTTLFERKKNGFQITNSGKDLLAYATNIETTVAGLQEDINAGDNPVSGLVRIASPDDFGNYFLASCLPVLSKQYSNLEINLLGECEEESLTRRETDIFISSQRPENDKLVTRRLVDYQVGLFASEEYLNNHPPITCKAELSKHELIGYTDNIAQKNLDNSEFFNDRQKASFRSCNLIAQYQAILQGHGVCFLPYYVVNNKSLIQILPHELEFTQTLWLTMNEDMRHVARIRKVIDYIVDTTTHEKLYFSTLNNSSSIFSNSNTQLTIPSE